MIKQSSIIVIAILMGFSSGAQATPTCAHILHSLESQNTDNAAFIKDTSELTALISKLFEATDADAKKNLASEIAQKSILFSKSVQEFLQTRGLSYQVTDSPLLSMGDFGIQWPAFEILPSGKDRLNKVAKNLIKEARIRLVFDPIGNTMIGANGAFVEKVNAVMISTEALMAWPLDYVVGHEIIHAYFAAYRAGVAKKISNAPVHIVFSSKESLNPQALSQGYTKMMSYEEMLTHAYNVTMISKAILKNRDIPGVVGTNGKQQFLNNAVSILVTVAENAQISAQKALTILDSGKPPLVEVVSGKNEIILEDPSLQFKISVFVPKNVLDQPGFQPSQYARQELEKALRLAEHTLKYFAEASSVKLNPIDAKKAESFRGEQKAFMDLKLN